MKMTEIIGKFIPGFFSVVIGTCAMLRVETPTAEFAMISGLMVFWGITVAYPEALNMIDDICNYAKTKIGAGTT